MRAPTVRPSGLDLTVACPASVKLQASVPNMPPTEEQAEGIAGHAVAQTYAAGVPIPLGGEFVVAGRTWKADEDMVAGARLFAAALGGVHSELRVEETIAIPRIHPDCVGRPDAWRYIPGYQFPDDPQLPKNPVNLLRVGEYKYGHRFIEVFENYTLCAYAAGVMDFLQLSDNDPLLWLELILVQPRSYHKDGPVRFWRIPAHAIRATINVAASAAREALGPSPRARTSERCADCHARHACSTFQKLAYALVDLSGTAEITELPPETMGQELALIEDAIDRLTARRDGLAAQAEILLRQGKRVASYHLEGGLTPLTYRDGVSLEELINFGDLVGVDLRKPATLKTSVVTPTQAIAKGIDPEIMSQYAHRLPTPVKLVRDNSIVARKVFSK